MTANDECQQQPIYLNLTAFHLLSDTHLGWLSVCICCCSCIRASWFFSCWAVNSSRRCRLLGDAKEVLDDSCCRRWSSALYMHTYIHTHVEVLARDDRHQIICTWPALCPSVCVSVTRSCSIETVILIYLTLHQKKIQATPKIRVRVLFSKSLSQNLDLQQFSTVRQFPQVLTTWWMDVHRQFNTLSVHSFVKHDERDTWHACFTWTAFVNI